jgi:hypothetical protein
MFVKLALGLNQAAQLNFITTRLSGRRQEPDPPGTASRMLR